MTKKVSSEGGSAWGGKKIVKSAKKAAVKKEELVKAVKMEKAAIEKKEKRSAQPMRYFSAKGGRKTAVARVRLFTKQKGIIVNGKDYKEYFKNPHLQKEIEKPFSIMNVEYKLGVTVVVHGGGLMGQADAVRHGISRALVLFNPDFRKRLRREGFLTRDPRMVERKKYGLKKARRAPQWAKR